MAESEGHVSADEECSVMGPNNVFEITGKGTSQDGLFVWGELYKKNIDCLIDTGATISVLHSRVYKNLPEAVKPPLEKDCGKLEMADGELVTPMGMAIFPLRIQGDLLPCQMIVADIEVPAVLGYDFLKRQDSEIKLGKEVVTFKGREVPCHLESQRTKTVFRIRMAERVVVPAATEAIVPAEIVGDYPVEKDAVIENGSKYLKDKGILVGRCVFDTTKTIIPVRVMNMTDKPQTIPKQVTAASCETIRAEQVESVNLGEITGPEEKIRNIQQISEEQENLNNDLPAHLEQVLDACKTTLEDDQIKEVTRLLNKHQTVFAKNKDDLGKTGIVKHKIKTGEAPPIKQAPRRIPLAKRADAEAEIQRMLKTGVITPSKSPWASGIVLVKKSDNSWRFCVDYRKLNEVTIKDSYPLPRIDDSLDTLRGSSWFSVLDLQSGYWQVEVDPQDREKTAFVTTSGLYEFQSMPFGLCNAAATFERLMECILRDEQWHTCLIYVDDIIIFANSFEQHLERLDVILEKIKAAGLKISPKKCKLLQPQVKFLGHLVQEKGISPDPAKTKMVDTWPQPKCVREVRSFLGTVSYYRKFIRGFATIAKPLHRLTEKEMKFIWTEECQQAYTQLKRALVTSPVLVYPNAEKPYILDTDASGFGIGGVLSQQQEDGEHPICYFSRTLSKTERQYCVTRRELLAVVEAVKHFHHYLYGAEFLVRTDHGALNWIRRFKNPEGQLARWLEVLDTYNYQVQHRPGRVHANADGLSRRICGSCKFCKKLPDQANEMLEETEEPLDSREEKIRKIRLEQPTDWFQGHTAEEWMEGQKGDPNLKHMWEWKRRGKRPEWKDVAPMSKEVKCYWAQWKRIEFREGILYRVWIKEETDEEEWQVLVPKSWTSEIMESLHNGVGAGHLGLTKTIARLRERFYWAGLTRMVHRWIDRCKECQARKQPRRSTRGKLKQYRVGVPMERVALDIMVNFPESPRGNRYVLVITDYFTRWAEAYPIPNQEATTVADVLVKEFISRYGIPRQIHSDQGRQFESNLFQELCQKLGMKKTRTTPYHPQGDGLVERLNRTIEDMLSKVISKNQKDWEEYLPLVMYAYRSSVQESTGESPAMMMLGREVELPVDLLYGRPPRNGKETNTANTEYVEELIERMRKIHDHARDRMRLTSDRQKKYYDLKTSDPEFRIGDRVWMYENKSYGGSRKLGKPWEGPYTITKQLSDVVYCVKRGPHAKTRVVNVNKLKPYKGEAKKWFVPESDRTLRT